MKLSIHKQRKGSREYTQVSLRFTKEDRVKVPNPAQEYLPDQDTQGNIILYPINPPSNATVSSELCVENYSDVKPHTSIRLHVCREKKDRFKELCHSKGSTMCRVLSNYIEATLAADDAVLQPGGVVINNVFTGVPRGKSDKVLTVCDSTSKTTIPVERAERSEASDTQPQPTDAQNAS